MWPSISPHRPGTPGSVWDLPYNMFVIFAAGADEWERQQKDTTPPQGPGSIRYRKGR